MWNRTLLKTLVVLLYVMGLTLPICIFFHERGGTAFLHAASLKVSLQLLFPLVGLYAFTFVTWQVLLATNLRWLERLWPNIIQLHRFQGSFALLFAFVHPTFILLAYGLNNYLHFRYTASGLRWWLLPAYTALTIMFATVVTASFAWYGRNIPWWRKLHKLNYLVFVLVWLHSWFIGSDVTTSLLKALWIIYLVAVMVSAAGKYRYKFTREVQNA